VDGVDECVRSE